MQTNSVNNSANIGRYKCHHPFQIHIASMPRSSLPCSDQPAVSEIRLRDARFVLDSKDKPNENETVIPRHWYRGWSHVTRFFDALSIMFPLGEQLFIDSVRHFRDSIPASSALADQVARFTYQEASHIREHRAYNRRLAAQGMPVEALEELIARRQAASRRMFSAHSHLALTACLEHFTAILADQLLRRPAILALCDPRMAKVWRWHAIEEIEHREVAFDVLLHVDSGALRLYLRRCGVMLGITVFFLADLFYFNVRLIVSDRRSGDWRQWLRLQWWLFINPGVLTRVAPAWLRWFAPGFHPRQIDNAKLLELARKELDQHSEDSPQP